ncbi:uncharacterized protein LOC141526681 [Cotesia typhae]|uniref:uncharacterized protein LOC141526681 n=1 Tax=Cotesia typhae TaxID=2053667 RepID=UPI003D69A5C3
MLHDLYPFFFITIVCFLFIHHCNLKLEKPCCDENHECKVLDISTHENVYMCLKKIMVGDTCRYLVECWPLENAICSNRKCRCLPNYGPTSNKTNCVPLLDGDCDEDKKCYSENSECVDNYCQCKERFIMNFMKQCVRSAIGRSCDNKLACGDPFYYNCENGKCACKKNYILVNNASCLPLLGEFCWTNEPCGLKYSKCLNNKCQCIPNYNAVSNDECILDQN